MCPVASGAGGKKYWLKDHDAAVIYMHPPVDNLLYEVFHAKNVRLLWCTVLQINGEADPKSILIDWTIDGVKYEDVITALHGITYYVYKDDGASNGGSAGLTETQDKVNAAYHVDKRGLDFKVEVELWDTGGTAQILLCHCVYETLEETT